MRGRRRESIGRPMKRAVLPDSWPRTAQQGRFGPVGSDVRRFLGPPWLRMRAVF
jgi:hypothetical protein